jgi:hypothetical protein
MLDHLWRSLGSWHRPDMERFVPQAVTIARAGQNQSSALTAAYLSRWGALHDVSLPTAHVPGLDQIRGIDPAQEYQRPFVALWTALSNGQQLSDAVDAGAQRLESLITTDMQLAKTKTAQAMLGDNEKVVGYRRVLEGAYSCGLCIVASTQRYHKGELMPIHPGCDCSVAPILGHHDLGRLLNLPDLQAVHSAIGDRFGASSPAAAAVPGLVDGNGDPTLYRDVIVVHQHGEIGPVLAVRGQDWTAPSDLPGDPKTTP